ncbi:MULTISPECIES: hypothetical protein [Nitrosospira]|uniref:hypothetical protein n=1 Tax=Nitrosospira TaxID=35798 RepID=UPI000D2F5185|nr:MULTISPECIES: hypothetical protein [Nitrosospira]
MIDAVELLKELNHIDARKVPTDAPGIPPGCAGKLVEQLFIQPIARQQVDGGAFQACFIFGHFD